MSAAEPSLDIAVVAMSCRLPGAPTVDAFWRNLREGVESIALFSDDQLRAAGVSAAELVQPSYVKAAGVLGDSQMFDAAFFGYSPREAELLDPQQRLFLECAWEALERAGYRPDRCPVSVGVYAGAGFNRYLLHHALTDRERVLASSDRLIAANDKDFLATRVSYKLNLTGPSVAVQTACSTSLVAVHLACQGLLGHACDMALAGGVSLRVPEIRGYQYEEEGISSPDGHCRAFDASARGTVDGSGAGVVVLKRLEDALASGDQILAIVKGSAINNDGATKIGFTAPSVAGQAAVIRAAQEVADIEPDTIGYVEAHGTGTALGDPIEVAALTQAFRARTARTGFCALGSVKTNIGHLDTAAGIAGFIKAVLALHHGELPPSLHFERPNPLLELARSPFYVNTELIPWPAGPAGPAGRGAGAPRRAAVSSFGVGGTNAHVILEEAPSRSLSASASASEPAAWQLLPVSARSEQALQTASDQLADALARHPDLDLADVAFTLQVGRKDFSHRRVIVARSSEQAVELLRSSDPARIAVPGSGERPEVVFLFPGQGSEYVGMGGELYRRVPVFRAEVDRCAALLEGEVPFDVREIFVPGARARDELARLLVQTAHAQIALFVLEYALARTWMGWGVVPDALLGHSFGEYVAACLSGVMDLAAALRLVVTRGRLMQAQRPGRMLSVSLGPDALTPLLGEDLSLAAVNGPERCVVSGSEAAIERCERALRERGVACLRLATSHGFHSALMAPAMAPLADALRATPLAPPRIPYLSNLTGRWVTPEQATSADAWARQMREPVQFSGALLTLAARDVPRVYLEVGPGQTLGQLTRGHAAGSQPRLVLASLPGPRAQESDTQTVLHAVGRLWSAGAAVDVTACHDGADRRRVALPTYPWERKPFWLGAQPAAIRSQRTSDVEDWFYVPAWKQALPPRVAERSEDRVWLIFLDGSALGGALAQRLGAAPDRVVAVRPAQAFRRIDAATYELDRTRRADYEALLSDLRERGLYPDVVVQLSADGDDGGERTGSAVTDHAVFDQLLHLAQALAATPPDAPLQVCVVASGLHVLTGEERAVRPDKATVLGLCKVMELELPHVRARTIDLTLPGTDHALARLSAQLVAELRAVEGEAIVAYRAGQRWVQQFERAVLPELGAHDDLRVSLRPGGVYLITGGLGHVGLLLAEEIARQPGVKLVLVGRTELPPRERWQALTAAPFGVADGRGQAPSIDRTAPEADAVARRVRGILRLEAAGAEVWAPSADVADGHQMAGVAEQLRARFGRLDGVIHAAGLVDERSIRSLAQTDAQTVAAQFRPKIGGALVLDALVGELRPEFCVLISSLSTILGGTGYAAYAAANAFLDAHAHERCRSGGTAWLSIDWDGFASGNHAGGSAAEGQRGSIDARGLPGGGSAAEGQRGSIDARGLPGGGSAAEGQRGSIDGQQAQRVFARLLPYAGRLTRVAVSTRDLNERLREVASVEARLAERLRAPGAEASAQLAGDFEGEVERDVAGLFADALGVPTLGRHDSFLELGGDSLVATHVLSRLRGSHQVELSLREFFELPTVAGLAAHIARKRDAWAAAQEAEITQLLDRMSDEEIEVELEKRQRAQRAAQQDRP